VEALPTSLPTSQLQLRESGALTRLRAETRTDPQRRTDNRGTAARGWRHARTDPGSAVHPKKQFNNI